MRASLIMCLLLCAACGRSASSAGDEHPNETTDSGSNADDTDGNAGDAPADASASSDTVSSGTPANDDDPAPADDGGTPLAGDAADSGTVLGDPLDPDESGAGTGADGGIVGVVPGDVLPCDACNTTSEPYCHPTFGVCAECVEGIACSAGSMCEAGHCVPVPLCANSLDCEEPGLVCVEQDPDEVMSVDPEMPGHCVGCGANADCDTEEICINGSCEARCSSDNDCTPDGLLCHSDRYCAECVDDSACPDESFCFEGKCKADLCTPTHACFLAPPVTFFEPLPPLESKVAVTHLVDEYATCRANGGGYTRVTCGRPGCSVVEGEPTCVEFTDFPPDNLIENGFFVNDLEGWTIETSGVGPQPPLGLCGAREPTALVGGGIVINATQVLPTWEVGDRYVLGILTKLDDFESLTDGVTLQILDEADPDFIERVNFRQTEPSQVHEFAITVNEAFTPTLFIQVSALSQQVCLTRIWLTPQ